MKRKDRYTVGFLIDWAEDTYHTQILAGINDAAINHNVNLFVFVGGCINTPRKWEKPRNLIYNFIDDRIIDGLIISSGSVGHFSDHSQLEEFFSRFASIPCISISQEVKGSHSILVDNRKGLKELVQHFIQVHDRKKIAFIRGPKGNSEAEERYNVFCDTLIQENIPIDPALILPGFFSYDTGKKAIELLVKERKAVFDSVIAANDDMAWGALEALRGYNISVPEKVLVGSFDDQSLSKFVSPPLTTVRQPLYLQGYQAISDLTSILNGDKEPGRIVLNTELMIRRSCGCNNSFDACISLNCDSHMVTLKGEGTEKEQQSISFKRLIDNRVSIYEDIISEIEELFLASRINIIPDEIGTCIEAFFEAVDSKNVLPFFDAIFRFLNKIQQPDQIFTLLQNVISLMRKYIVEYIDSKDDLLFAENLLHRARILITENVERAYGYAKTIAELEISEFRDISEELISIKNLNELMYLMIKEFPLIGINSFYFTLYKDESMSREPRDYLSTLMYAYDKSGEINIDDVGIEFPTYQFIPDNVWDGIGRFTFVIEPLFLGGDHLGLALFELDMEKGPVYNIMRRTFLNTALKTVVYVHHIQQQRVNLEEIVQNRTKELFKANELLSDLFLEKKESEEEVRRLNMELEQRVKERTAQLKEMNQELIRTLNELETAQERLVQSKKMSALGGLVAGVAHEINTPIGIGVTAASHLDSITQNLKKQYELKSLKRSDLEEFINVATSATSMVLGNLQRAYELISSFKKIAVDQSTEEKRKFNLKEYLEDILLSLRPELKKTSHQIVVRCAPDIHLKSYPGVFSQIVTNLVMNSLIHGFENLKAGKIYFRVKAAKKYLVFKYSDNGKGIDKRHLEKIFDPFFTTKRGHGGTGLGMHLVFNLVTQKLGGSIRCISKTDRLTTFIISVPYEN